MSVVNAAVSFWRATTIALMVASTQRYPRAEAA